MKPIFTFPPPRLRRAMIPLKNPKNLSEQTGPPQFSTLALEGATVTIDAMGTQANIAEAIRARGRSQDDARAAALHQQPGAGRGEDRGRGARSLVGRKSPPLAHGYCLQRRSDARPHTPRRAAHNLASLKQLTLNLIRMDPVKRKGGIKARRIIAATSDNYRAHLLGLG